MSFQPNAGATNSTWNARKPKRVSDVNAMGPAASMPANVSPFVPNAGGPSILDPSMPAMASSSFNQTIGVAPGVASSFENGNVSMRNMSGLGPHQVTQPTPAMAQQQFNNSMPRPNAAGNPQFAQFSMFQQPIVQDMAMQYGQHLADQGKQIVESQISKWIPVSKLKYYFAVDNNYVIKKLRLLFFPFVHQDWSLKYDEDNPVQPRYDINAPDLYIPSMAFITYVVVAGLMLGLQKTFTPEKLSIHASSALAYCIVELIIYSVTLYIVNIKTNIRFLDLTAFAGYKFVTIVACLLASTIFYGFGYYTMLCYCSLSLGFFLLRTLKNKVSHETAAVTNTASSYGYDSYANQQPQIDYNTGRKRKLYFLFLMVVGQAVLSFLLSKHLYISKPALLGNYEADLSLSNVN